MRDRVLLGVAYVAGLRASEIGPLEAEGVVWQEATQTFSILVRRVLKRGSFGSVAELRQRILDFIAYFNQTLAKPFRWTYTGRPLQAGVR